MKISGIIKVIIQQIPTPKVSLSADLEAQVCSSNLWNGDLQFYLFYQSKRFIIFPERMVDDVG